MDESPRQTDIEEFEPMGIPQTAKQVVIGSPDISRIAPSDMIAENWREFDVLGMMRPL